MEVTGFRAIVPGYIEVNPPHRKLNPFYSMNVRRMKKSNKPY